MRSVSKVLHFPFAGLSRSLSVRDNTQPSETRTYGTPLALNVRGSCTFADRKRGGSRPGLAPFGEVVSSTTGRWLWPNGEPVLWPGGAEMLFRRQQTEYTAPDGASIIDSHAVFTVAASRGAAPSSPTAFTFYRARAIVAEEVQWYASAVGDVTDWDYGGDSDNPARAVSGNLALAGRRGEKITAFMAVDDSRLYAATARSLFVMSDPAAGMQRVSEFVGCVSANAWCVVHGALYTLSTQGLYRITPGELPLCVDAEIPEALRGASAALLAYDPEEDAIHIFTDLGDFFFDVGEPAFWPVSIPQYARPSAIARCISGKIDKTLLLGADGTWRTFSATTTKDDSTVTLSSIVAIGPFRTSGRDDEDGMLDTLHMVLATGSADVSLEIYPARTAEAALDKATATTPAPAYTATVGAGFNHTIRPRVRGAWCVIVLRGTGRWAYETATATCKQLGRLR